MSNSYKFYSDTKDIMKKYVNATEGAIIYGISKSRIVKSKFVCKFIFQLCGFIYAAFIFKRFD